MTRSLREFGIHTVLVDEPVEEDDAQHVLDDSDRFAGSVRSIAGDVRVAKQAVLVETRFVDRQPQANIPGDFNKYLHRTIESIRAGDTKATLERMAATFGAYASGVRDAVDAAIAMGAVTPVEKVALICVYEAVRRSLPRPELYSQLG